MSSEYTSSPIAEIPTPTSSRLESIAFYVFLVAVFLTPVAFWASTFISLDLVKTFVIALGVLISAILYGIVALKERRLVLPPKGILFSAKFVAASLIISSLVSGHSGKSFFGQGFELGVASFVLILFVAAWIGFTAVQRKPERAVLFYMALIIPFFVLAVFHGLRLLIGGDFLSLGILSSVTTTVFGTWYSFGTYAIVAALILFGMILFLPLSRGMKTVYWILLVLAVLMALVTTFVYIWIAACIVCLGLTIYLTLQKPKNGPFFSSEGMKRIAWIPLVATLVLALLIWKGGPISTSIATSFKAEYGELSLPWQMTLDVGSEAIKDSPLFGAGPNRFLQAFLMNKPALINLTDAWGIEFNSGFAQIPTYVVTQGLVGGLAWLLFLIFFVVSGVKALRRLPSEPSERFLLVSSFSVSTFLWIMSLLYTSIHSLLFYTFLSTGIFFALAIAYGGLSAIVLSPIPGSWRHKMFPSFLALLMVVAITWGLIYIKKTAALAYFDSGIKQMTVSNNADAADKAFAKALSLDSSDIYWQARAEAKLVKAQQLMTTVSQNMPAAQAQPIVDQVATAVREADSYAKQAIALDKDNYYNYVSAARVSETAANLRMDGAYDSAVTAYMNAIHNNPQNPQLYLNLARMQASQSKYDEAVQTLGAALQVKNNYLDAVFLLSQIEGAQGKLADAIVAAQFAIRITSNNPLLYFQLGLLQYSNKDYTGAADALKRAIVLQPDYANAKYFLGLSLSRLGRNTEAIPLFQDLVTSNPDNKEVELILNNLRAGRSAFADAQPPVTPTPEKRSSLPIKEKKR